MSWWTRENHLLVHGLNLGGNTKGDYVKKAELPEGEICCSIISPVIDNTYSPIGLILKACGPSRFSFKDVGSCYASGQPTEDERTTKGSVWKCGEMSHDELMFLTAAAGTYNEVLVAGRDTEVVGMFGCYSTVDEFVDLFTSARALDSGNELSPENRILCNYILQSDFYVSVSRNMDRRDTTWLLSDTLSRFYEGSISDLAGKIEKGCYNVEAAVTPVGLDNLMGGEFCKQPILESHKRDVAYALERDENQYSEAS